MALSPTLVDREQGKFRDTGTPTSSKVAVQIEGSDIPFSSEVASFSTYVNTVLTVDSVTAQPARVGGSNLTNRKLLVITNRTTGYVHIGDSSVSTANSIRIIQDQQFAISVGPLVTMYVIRDTGSGPVVIEEFA